MKRGSGYGLGNGPNTPSGNLSPPRPHTHAHSIGMHGPALVGMGPQCSTRVYNGLNGSGMVCGLMRTPSLSLPLSEATYLHGSFKELGPPPSLTLSPTPTSPETLILALTPKLTRNAQCLPLGVRSCRRGTQSCTPSLTAHTRESRPCLQGKSRENTLNCPLFARKRNAKVLRKPQA